MNSSNYIILFLELVIFSHLGICSPEEPVNELDFIELRPYEPYDIQRLRWADLNQISGYRTSGKILKYTPLDTPFGKVEMPQEDLAKLKTLSKTELHSVLNTKRNRNYEAEEKSKLGLELIDEGEINEGIKILQSNLLETEKEFGQNHILYANMLADLGRAHFLKSNFNSSLEYMRKALDVDSKLKKQYGPKNYAASVNFLVKVALASGNGNFNTLSSLLEGAFNELLEEKDDDRFKLLLNLANMYRHAKLPIRAISMLKLARHTIPQTSILLFDTYLYLAQAYILRNEFKKALNLLLVAKNGYEEISPYRNNMSYYNILFLTVCLENRIGNHKKSLRKLVSLKHHLNQEKGEDSMIVEVLISSTMGQIFLALNEMKKSVMFLEASQTLISTNKKLSVPRVISMKIAHYYAKALDKLKDSKNSVMQHQNAFDIGTKLFGESHHIVKEHEAFTRNKY